jgi:hypothetical protein
MIEYASAAKKLVPGCSVMMYASSNTATGFHRADQNVGVAAFHARHAVDRAVSRKVFGEPQQQLAPEIGVGDFAAAELHDGLHAVAFLKEADGVVLLEVVVVVVGVGPELQLLHLHHVLLLLGFVLLLFQLVLIVAVIDRLGHGRHRRGRHHHQIQPQFLRPAQSGGSGHNFGGAIGEDRAYLPCTDRFVNVFSATSL